MVREGVVDFLEEQTLYDILQVSPKASPEVIQAAYRVLARTVHPDVSAAADAENTTRRLNAAHDVLSDPLRRAAYDASRAEAERIAASRRPRTDPRRSPSPARDYPTQRAPASTVLVWAVTASVAVTIVIAMLIVLWSIYDTLDSFGGSPIPANGSMGAPSKLPWTPIFNVDPGAPHR